VSTEIHDTGAIPRVPDASAASEASSADWQTDTLAQRFDTLPAAVKAQRETPLFMDAPPLEAEPAPVVVPVSYPSSDADSFFDRTWFETGAINVDELREQAVVAEPAPMRVEHVTVTPNYVDPIAAGLAAEHGVEIPEPATFEPPVIPAVSYDTAIYHATSVELVAVEPVAAERPIDERPVFERPIYEPVEFDEADDFFVAAPVVSGEIHQDFDPSLFAPREVAAQAVTVEALAASFETMDPPSPVVDRSSEFESYDSDYQPPAEPAPDYAAESPGDAWYVEPPFIKGEGIVPVGGTPSRWGKLLVPIALGAVAIMALIAGWTHFQNSNTETNVVVAPTNQPAASTVPTPPIVPPVPVVPTPVISIVPTIPTPAPVVPTPDASSAAPVVAGDRSVPVVVLNGSGTSGLAAKVADDLRAKGWKVVSVGNYSKTPATQTTVYSPGPRTASATMRRDVPQSSLTHKPLPGMSKTQITLVIGSDYSA
jgi:hypothetical protein